MNPSVSLTSACMSRRSAARTSACVSTTIGSTPAGIASGGPKRRARLLSTAIRSRAPPLSSSASTASEADAAATITIRFGILAQTAGSLPAAVNRSSQSVSARIDADAMTSGAAGEDIRLAANWLQPGTRAAPSVAPPFRRYDKHLAISGAPRRQNRAPDKTQPQNHASRHPGPRRAGFFNRGRAAPQRIRIGARA